MIRRDHGELACECNECGEEYYGGTLDDFREFVEELKSAGWLIRKDGDEWQHICDECRKAVGP